MKNFSYTMRKTHSERCLTKKVLLDTESKILNHKFSSLFIDSSLRNDINKKIIELNNLYHQVKIEYNNVLDDVIFNNNKKSLTDGIDFTRGKKIRMYKSALNNIDSQINLYKEFINKLGDIDSKFDSHNNDVNKIGKQLIPIGSCQNLHIYCHCVDDVKAAVKEECGICFDNKILHNIKCGNKHFLCKECIIKIIDSGINKCPYCRNKFNLQRHIVKNL